MSMSFRHLNSTFGWSHIAGSAYQKWPTESFIHSVCVRVCFWVCVTCRLYHCILISVVKDPQITPLVCFWTVSSSHSRQWQIAPFTPIVTPFLHPRHMHPITSKTIQRITHVSLFLRKKQPHTRRPQNTPYTVQRFDSPPEIWGISRSLMRVRQTDFQEKVDAKFTFQIPCGI